MAEKSQDDQPRTVTLTLGWDDEPPSVQVSFIVHRHCTRKHFRDQLDFACNTLRLDGDAQAGEILNVD